MSYIIPLHNVISSSVLDLIKADPLYINNPQHQMILELIEEYESDYPDPTYHDAIAHIIDEIDSDDSYEFQHKHIVSFLMDFLN